MAVDPDPAAPSSALDVRAKALPRLLPIAGAPPDLVPARMINEALYCERLLYLEWAQGEFVDNVFTVDGRNVHKRADQPGGRLPVRPSPADIAIANECADVAAGPATASNDAQSPLPANTPMADDGAASTSSGDVVSTNEDAPAPEPRPYQARTLWLSSEKLGITAKIDVVEGSVDGRVVPVEYKRGKAPELPEGAYLPERAQLCAQVLLLREHGYRCEGGEIYFAGSRRRVAIVIDDALVATTLAAAARAKEITGLATAPAPLVDSPKCNGCSLVGVCLPDEVNLLREQLHDEPGPREPSKDASESVTSMGDAPAEDERGAPHPALRRLHPASDDKLPLYVQDQGARITLDGDCLVIHGRKTQQTEVRLPNTSHVVVYGNVQITAQAMRALLERGIPISLLSYGGWYYGRASGVESKNVELRIAQHRVAADPERCLVVARGLVASKIRNGRTLLRRNHSAPPLLVLTELERLARKAEQAAALDALLGLEGTAARWYFGEFTGMLKGAAALSGAFDLDGRNRRPPKDPVNALLSFVYSLLTKDFALASSAVGLDPLLGFYHQPRFGRPALALDLMEEFRPLVADSVVIGALNGGSFEESDFIVHPSGVAMRPAARRRLLIAYERRMDQLITHPVFGYRISYRRVIEVQSRLFARFLLGEIAEYPSFRTR